MLRHREHREHRGNIQGEDWVGARMASGFVRTGALILASVGTRWHILARGLGATTGGHGVEWWSDRLRGLLVRWMRVDIQLSMSVARCVRGSSIITGGGARLSCCLRTENGKAGFLG